MAIPIIKDWNKYFNHPHEGLGSSYERIVLNRLLLEVARKYQVGTALETPSFGFTGISGINLMALADSGVSVSLEDHDEERLELVFRLWQSLGRPLRVAFNADYRSLGYPDCSFDLSFSFSALWFTGDLRSFLKELSRVTAKAILISVPNQDGIGYKMQIKDYSEAKYPDLRLEHIDPASIARILLEQGWRLVSADYIDCPPWPDIGMAKEDFFRKLRGIHGTPTSPSAKKPCHGTPTFPSAMSSRKPEPCVSLTDEDVGNSIKSGDSMKQIVSILDYYNGKAPGFADRMLRYGWFERLAPTLVKRFWAHHYYMLFEPVK